MIARNGAIVLRLEWRDVDDLGGAFILPDPDAIIRIAERDLDAASSVARTQSTVATRRSAANDLPDLLATHLVARGVPRLATWAEDLGLARETVSRAFTSAFGVSARQFRAELRAREAWLSIVRTQKDLAEIAATAGFTDQAHMTRHIRRLTGITPGAWRRRPLPFMGPRLIDVAHAEPSASEQHRSVLKSILRTANDDMIAR